MSGAGPISTSPLPKTASPERVGQLLLQVAGAHPEALKAPQPLALFAGFGNSALNFQLQIWTPEEIRDRVASELRTAISRVLGEAGIRLPPERGAPGVGARVRAGAAGAGGDPRTGPRARARRNDPGGVALGPTESSAAPVLTIPPQGSAHEEHRSVPGAEARRRASGHRTRLSVYSLATEGDGFPGAAGGASRRAPPGLAPGGPAGGAAARPRALPVRRPPPGDAGRTVRAGLGRAHGVRAPPGLRAHPEPCSAGGGARAGDCLDPRAGGGRGCSRPGVHHRGAPRRPLHGLRPCRCPPPSPVRSTCWIARAFTPPTFPSPRQSRWSRAGATAQGDWSRRWSACATEKSLRGRRPPVSGRCHPGHPDSLVDSRKAWRGTAEHSPGQVR